jgi:hypothetical protein
MMSDASRLVPPGAAAPRSTARSGHRQGLPSGTRNVRGACRRFGLPCFVGPLHRGWPLRGLSRYEGKLSRTVLRGKRVGDRSCLPRVRWSKRRGQENGCPENGQGAVHCAAKPQPNGDTHSPRRHVRGGLRTARPTTRRLSLRSGGQNGWGFKGCLVKFRKRLKHRGELKRATIAPAVLVALLLGVSCY